MISNNELDRWRREARRAVPAATDDLIEEIALHVAERCAGARAAGRTDREADAIAFADLADWQGRAVPPGAGAGRRRATDLFTGLGLDLAAAWRAVATRPMFAAGAGLLIAIAVAANAAAFAIAYGVIWRPLPYPSGDRLVTLWQLNQGDAVQVSYPDYRDLSATGAFELSGVVSGGIGTLVVNGSADRVHAVEVEPAVLSLLGARPVLGRLLTADDGGKPLAMISHRAWQTYFGADPQITARSFVLSGTAYSIIGVLSPGFDLELPVAANFEIARNDVWTAFDRATPFLARRDVSSFEVLARLAPGITLEGARTTIDTEGATLEREFASTNHGRRFQIIPLAARVSERAARPLRLACLAAGIVLVIALANLTALALGRIVARNAELSVRRSLGATRWRLVRLLLIENMLVAIPGVVVGAAAGGWLSRALADSQVARLPRPDAVTFDLPVGLAVLMLAMMVGGIPPLASHWLATRGAPTASADGRIVGRAGRRPRRWLVSAEVALALVLSASAALLSLTLARLFSVNPGFSTTSILTMRVSAYPERYPDRAAAVQFFTRLVSQLSSLPGVDAVSTGSSLPLSGQSTGTAVMSAEHPLPPADQLSAGWQTVAPGYFRAAGIPIVRGRDITESDVRQNAHVTVINESVARALFGDADPIGRRVSIGGGDRNGDWHEVIGVAGDVRHISIATAPTPRVYDAFGQHWGRTMYLVVRGEPGADLGTVQSEIRRAVAAMDPGAPVFDIATMEALAARSVDTRRLAAWLAGGLALVSVLLALIGTFAVVSCGVSERIREIGVRIALGATGSEILRLVLGEAAVTAVGGCIAGVAGAALAARALSAQLIGVSASDAAAVVVSMAIALAAASVAAAWWPARRATAADPLTAMRGNGE